MDTSTGNVTGWFWDFGDGSNSTEQNPIYQYVYPNSYNVTLFVYNEYDSDFVIRSIIVNPPDPPIASYTYTPTTGEAPLSISFTDTSSGPPAYWLWDFGDGWSSTVQNPTHTFADGGTYNVTLEVTNSAGSSQVTHQIIVLPRQRPTAGFSATPTSGNAPLTVQFTDESSETTINWFWEFGDGYFSHAQNPAHTYPVAGTYTVILSAYNDYGSDTMTRTNYITVGSGLVSSSIICGLVYDISDNTNIDAATVTIKNSTWSDTTTSHDGGYYEFSNLTPGAYTVQGSKPGYASSTTYPVQAYQDSVSQQRIALTVSGVSLTGVCYDAEKSVPLAGTTVTATQGSTTVSNTTGADGTYVLDAFSTGSTITISASCSGYWHTPITVTPTTDGPITRDLYLLSNTLTHNGTAIAGIVTSTKDDQAIEGATVTAKTSDNSSTKTALTNPTAYYIIDDLTPEQWGVSASATGYVTSSTYTHDLEENNVTIQCFRLDPSTKSSSLSYTPKQVRFTYLSSTGSPISGLSVSAVGSSTTAGSWDWFLSLFGIDVSDTNLATSTMTGITGSDGSITFMMLPSVYYAITASNPDEGISISTNIYPTEDEYVFTVWGNTASSSSSQITYSLNAAPINDTYTALEISYLDTGNRTQSFHFTVYDEDRTLVHSETITENTDDLDLSYTVENDPGAIMYWGFNATLIGSDDQTEYLQKDQYIRFSGTDDTYAFGLPAWLLQWIAFGLLVVIGLGVGEMVGPAAMKFVGPIIGIFAMILKFIGWLPVPWVLVLIVFILGCLGYVRAVKDERMV